MTTDPIGRIAELRLLENSADLIVQLEKGTGTRPILHLLHKARARAVAANIQLVIADAGDTKTILKLQSEIAIYDDMVTACREIVADGRDAEASINDAERQEIQDVIMTPEQRQLHGFDPLPED